MRKALFCLAAIAAASALAACTTSQLVVTQNLAATAQDAITIQQQMITNDVALKLIAPTTAAKLNASLSAANVALEGLKDAIDAHDATTAKAKHDAVLRTVADVNSALLAAVAAYTSP